MPKDIRDLAINKVGENIRDHLFSLLEDSVRTHNEILKDISSAKKGERKVAGS